MLSCLVDVLASLRDVGAATFDCSPTPGTSRDKTCMLRREPQRKTAPSTKVVTRVNCLNVMHERSIGRDGLETDFTWFRTFAVRQLLLTESKLLVKPISKVISKEDSAKL